METGPGHYKNKAQDRKGYRDSNNQSRTEAQGSTDAVESAVQVAVYYLTKKE